MPAGPGKYDPECERVRETTRAAGVIMIVLDGDRGSGFSVTLDMLRASVGPGELSRILHDVANEIAGGPPS